MNTECTKKKKKNNSAYAGILFLKHQHDAPSTMAMAY